MVAREIHILAGLVVAMRLNLHRWKGIYDPIVWQIN